MTTTLAGPLASFYNFLSMIAFPNAIEYFEEKENTAPSDKTQRKLVRLLFNAVVSMDSAFDYRHWQTIQSDQNAEQIAKALEAYAQQNNCPALIELREVSNALKHCIRAKPTKGMLQRDDSKLHAHQIHSVEMTGELQFDGKNVKVDVTVTSTLIKRADEALEKAWQYWHEWHQTATSGSI